MRYKAVFLIPYGDKNYKKIAEKRFDPEKDTISFKDKTFVIPKTGSSYITQKDTYLFFDFKKGSIISFIEHDFGIDPTFLDRLLLKNIVAQLVSKLRASMEKPQKYTFLPYVIAFVFGAITGYLVYETYTKTQFAKMVLLWLLKLA